MFYYSTCQSRLVLSGLMPNILPQCTAEIVTEGLSVTRKKSDKEQQQRKVFIRSAINCWHQVKKWTSVFRWVEVGQASVVMAISSPHRQDGQQAIQHCINQLKAKIPIWKKVRAQQSVFSDPGWPGSCFVLTHWFSIDRKFTTHRTVAGRRTLSVRGQLTVSVIQTRHPQTTCEHEINGRWCCVSMCFRFCDSGNHPSFYRVKM